LDGASVVTVVGELEPAGMPQHKRVADIYNGVDKAKLPVGCRLGLDILEHGTKTPSPRKLRDSIEKWAYQKSTQLHRPKKNYGRG